MLGGFDSIKAGIFLLKVFKPFSSSSSSAMVLLIGRGSEGLGVTERSASWLGSGRIGGWIGGSSDLSWKKTESKLVDGDVGVPGARWWESDKVRFRGDEVLGECSGWGSGIGCVTWISKDEPCGELVRLI